ncbi:hypothetical protein, partial [Acetobacter fabarum]|uniref:hypothetical protein n=1 Tax=Acetobacter fabarum TaxID=483199 RepID=UPI00223259FE
MSRSDGRCPCVHCQQTDDLCFLPTLSAVGVFFADETTFLLFYIINCFVGKKHVENIATYCFQNIMKMSG